MQTASSFSKAVKLIIQVPCLDDAPPIAGVFGSLPRALVGVGEVEQLVVDDGSSDGTADVALAAGVGVHDDAGACCHRGVVRSCRSWTSRATSAYRAATSLGL